LTLRAIVFDYGLVLTGPQDPSAKAEILRLTGLTLERFEPLYWANRNAYDEGALTGIAFWQEFLRAARLPENQDLVEELNRLDTWMWGTENRAMTGWQLQLKERGFLTGILSNMGDSVCEYIEREHAWIQRFDVLVWSYQLRLAKPDPAIFRYILEKLGTTPAETLFIDDRIENIAAARALGMQAIEFTTAKRLRAELISTGLDATLPLPA
jgi:putative hydrolase of the HAD superfamily